MDNRVNTISPARPERVTLDFEKLRIEGLRRLEEWAPYIWTDFNAHDPGITILETLCYAITDLSYRTHLPLEDILAPGPTDLKKKFFFNAEEILPSGPLTEIDYRKLLIDIPGIKNAWLKKPATEVPAIFISEKTLIEHSHSNYLKDRLSKILDADVNNPKDISPFEENLLNLIGSNLPGETIEELKNLLEKFANTPKDFFNGGVARILEVITPNIDEEHKKPLEILVEGINQFYFFFNEYINYYKFLYNKADREIILKLKEKLSELPTSEIRKKLESILSLLSKGNSFSSNHLTSVLEYVEFLALSSFTDATIIHEFAKIINCDLAYFSIEQSDENNIGLVEQALNGLYEVKLELYDTTTQPESAAAKRIIKEVQNKLHSNRNLCEDFHTISILESQNICLCLDVELKPGLEEETMAEIIFRLQEFLTPTIKIYNLQQLLEKGLTGDQIFIGPLLENGFILDNELEKAVLPEKIFMSDLYRVILNVPGVININEFVIKRYGEKEYLKNLSCLDLKGLKPLIDILCSCLFISREGTRVKVNEKSLKEIIAFKELENRNISGSSLKKLPIPKGRYRENLSEFTSIQVEFPQTYAVGLNSAPPNASNERLGQIKQLQSYLSFYDRLMANYLQQLSNINKLFAIDQEIENPTYFVDTLYDIPGIKELIYQPAKLTKNGLNKLKDLVDEEVIKLLENSDIIKKKFDSFVGWNTAFEDALGNYWTQNSQVRNAISDTIKLDFNDQDWQAFINNDENYYKLKLQEIVESENKKHQRKDQILNHLLSRFGEGFTCFSLQQFGVSQEFSLYSDYKDFLKSKTFHLQNINILTAERAKAYNYRKFEKAPDSVKDSSRTVRRVAVKPDVWNTENVSGLKKRIYSLLNMGKPEARSVFNDPRYRIDLEEDDEKYLIYMVELDEKNKRKRVLLTSTESFKSTKAKSYQKKLNDIINNNKWLSIENNISEERTYWVQFSYPNIESPEIELRSEEMNNSQARNFKEFIEALTDAESNTIEAFHLIEHILLRPLVNDEALLRPTPGCCLIKTPPFEPYSFWISLVLPGWTNRFSDKDYRKYFEQLVRQKAPAHIAVCFRWLEVENITKMHQFEYALELWREAKVVCDPDACDVADLARHLIDLLNEMPCSESCDTDEEELICDCKEETKVKKNQTRKKFLKNDTKYITK